MQARETTPDVTAALDRWLERPAVRTHHRRSAKPGVEAEALWQAAKDIKLNETRMLGRLVRWRIPGLAADLTFHRLLGAYPFCVLEEGEQHSISGLCGKIWTLARDYPRIETPEEYVAFDRRDSVKVLLAHWIEYTPDGSPVLVHEARVKPVDRLAGVRLRALWTVISPFEGLVGQEAIAAAVRRANAG